MLPRQILEIRTSEMRFPAIVQSCRGLLHFRTRGNVDLLQVCLLCGFFRGYINGLYRHYNPRKTNIRDRLGASLGVTFLRA
jgi:hypothetical protein